MPSSGNDLYANTAASLCLSAAQELGQVGLGDSLDDAEQAEMIKRLNGMLAKWSIEANLFREASATVIIPAGEGAVTLPQGVRDVRGAWHITGSTTKRPLYQMNRDEYMGLPNRAQVGNPTIFYYSQQTEGDQFYVWPVPAAEASFEIDYSRAFYVVDAPEQTLDLPPEWYEAALYGLAARSANIFGRTSLDPQTVSRIDQQSKATYERLLDADRPDSYTFRYDTPLEAP